MKKRSDKDSEVIVKRRKKSNHDESHSGAWKVAFADFTMAMMALFMVLWVITPQNLEQSTAAEALTNPLVDGGAGVFDGNSRTPLELEGIPLQPNKPEVPDATSQNINHQPIKDHQQITDHQQVPHHQQIKYSSPAELKELAGLMQSLALQLDAQANIEIQVVPQGLRILIKDDQQRFMFERGSDRLNPHFALLLQRLAGVLAQVGNKLIISGHTDSTPYKRLNGYNNWNLSGDRALSARQVMVESGLAPGAVLQVAAQADVMPLHPQTPEDGANRRIEILLLTAKAEGLYREIFGDQQTRVDYSSQQAELIVPAKADTGTTQSL
ncbi:chemotaxis protein MotB [Cellvibrio sp. BR]|uniref:OmpA family protein n=1 Tax=Cellvibrio sp. BR TaxID=1134474 RepID=UPI00026011DA|nr:OmpA family protein [Cellvibrio sp. BR]EIK45730.1 chemotaxis protein MotB [Cellvibrio sp. BR]